MADSIDILTESSEAAEYVDSIMSTQRVAKVQTPVSSTRKRHRSVSGTCDTASKKLKNDSSPTSRDTSAPIKAKRNLYTGGPEQAPRNIVITQADVHKSSNPTMEQLFAKLSSDVNMMFLALGERFDKLECSLEQRISSKVATLLDKRVNTELNRVKRDVDAKLDSFKDSLKAELAADLSDFRDELSSLSASSSSGRGDRDEPSYIDRSRNIVIRNLAESSSENTQDKVNALLKDGLKLRNISVAKAVRKKSYNESKTGVVIATFKSSADKQSVMKAKPQLKDIDAYSSVFIHHDQPPSERSVNRNFATILNAMKSKSSDLSMKGSRVVMNNSNRDSSSYRQDRSYESRRGAPNESSGRSGHRDSEQSGRNRRNYGGSDHGSARRGSRGQSYSGNSRGYNHGRR